MRNVILAAGIAASLVLWASSRSCASRPSSLSLQTGASSVTAVFAPHGARSALRAESVSKYGAGKRTFAHAAPPIVTFDADSAPVNWDSGHWLTGVVNGGAIPPLRWPGYANSKMMFRFVGTDLGVTLSCAGPAGNFRYCIDGGTAQNIPVCPLALAILATGLSDAIHSVEIWHNGAGSPQNLQIQLPKGISIAGANPQLLAPAGFGVAYDILHPLIEIGGGQVNNLTGDNTLGFVSPQSGASAGSLCLRFRASDVTGIYLWMKGAPLSPTGIRVYRDWMTPVGAPVTASLGAGGGTTGYNWTAAVSGLNDGGTHDYLIYIDHSTVSAPVGALRITGGKLEPLTAIPRVAFLGDSTVRGAYGSPNTDGYAPTFCRLRHALISNYGVSGLRVTAPSGAYVSEEYYSRWVFNPRTFPDAILIEIGVNDQNGSTCTAADARRVYKAMLRDLARQTQCGPAVATPAQSGPTGVIPLYIIGILPNYGARAATFRPAFNAELALIVNELTAEGFAGLTYIDPDSFYKPTTVFMYDSLHPNHNGHAAAAAGLDAAIPPLAF